MAQKEHLRSHPLAILSGAIGALSNLLRSTVPKGEGPSIFAAAFS
jgi:hypothetical protein